MPEFTIPTDELGVVINKAILDSLSAETRERLIQEALTYLITPPPKERYGATPDPSPLQQAFQMALNRLSHQVADEVLESHDVKAQLTDRFVEMLDSIPDFDTDWTLQQGIMKAVLERAEDIRRRGK